MKSLHSVEEDIIEEFGEFPDVDSKYGYLFRIGNELPEMPPSLKNEKTVVRGCQSKLWFYLSADEGKLALQVDSDSMVTKGIGALLVRLVEGRKPEEIANLSFDFLDELGIWKLPSERNSGLMAMLDHIKEMARVIINSDINVRRLDN